MPTGIRIQKFHCYAGKHWLAARWDSMEDVRSAALSAKILNGERARFEIAGGSFRMIIAFDFSRGIAFVKFVGTHAEDDRIDALSISQF
jgi:mRNA interferase HigB